MNAAYITIYDDLYGSCQYSEEKMKKKFIDKSNKKTLSYIKGHTVL